MQIAVVPVKLLKSLMYQEFAIRCVDSVDIYSFFIEKK